MSESANEESANPAPASEPPITYADITKARALLGYDPHVSVEEGMTRFWEWYRAEVLPSTTTGGSPAVG